MAKLVHLAPLLALAGFTACATSLHQPIAPLYDGHEETWLTWSLSELVTHRVVLGHLRKGETPEAIEQREFELDAAILSLEEVARLGSAAGVAPEKQRLIYCHLRAIRADREAHPRRSSEPQIDSMVEDALARVPASEQVAASGRSRCA